MEISQSTVSYQQAEHSTAHREASLKLPYDEAPFEAFLHPGQMAKLYGGIEIQNDTGEVCHLTVRFDLRQGFILTVEGTHTPIFFETKVSMKTEHAVKIVDGGWQLIARNQPTQISE